MDQKRRIDRIEAKARERIKEFWDQFSDDELRAIRDGDPELIKECKRLGSDEIIDLEISLMTPDERAEFELIKIELQAQETNYDKGYC